MKLSSWVRLLFVHLVFLSHTMSAVGQTIGMAHVVFHKIDDESWQGLAEGQADIAPNFQLRRADSITTGCWRSDIRPLWVWAGVATDSGYVDSTIELEIYSNRTGVLRTQDGWFPVTGFAESSQVMQFDVSTSHEVHGSSLDRDIISRAAVILSPASVWHREDNRQCGSNATKWSIYCAMVLATEQITGGFHHRRPALQTIRTMVEMRTVGRKYRHRLMDYNNDTTTTYRDVMSLFKEALSRMQE